MSVTDTYGFIWETFKTILLSAFTLMFIATYASSPDKKAVNVYVTMHHTFNTYNDLDYVL